MNSATEPVKRRWFKLKLVAEIAWLRCAVRDMNLNFLAAKARRRGSGLNLDFLRESKEPLRGARWIGRPAPLCAAGRPIQRAPRSGANL